MMIKESNREEQDYNVVIPCTNELLSLLQQKKERQGSRWTCQVNLLKRLHNQVSHLTVGLSAFEKVHFSYEKIVTWARMDLIFFGEMKLQLTIIIINLLVLTSF